MSRTELIAEAEATALNVVALTEHERAAYRAAYLSDPYSRPTYERLHRDASAERYAEFEHLLALLHRLASSGLAGFAGSLWGTTVRNCQVAIDLAHANLMDELKGRDARATGTLSTAPPRQAAGQDNLHRVPDARGDGQARRAFELRQPPAPSAQEGEI